MITLKYTRLLSNKYTILIERCKYTKSSLIIICFLYFFGSIMRDGVLVMLTRYDL